MQYIAKWWCISHGSFSFGHRCVFLVSLNHFCYLNHWTGIICCQTDEACDKVKVQESDKEIYWNHFRNHIGPHPAINEHDHAPDQKWHQPIGLSGDDARYTLAGRKIIVMMLSFVLQEVQSILLLHWVRTWKPHMLHVYQLWCRIDTVPWIKCKPFLMIINIHYLKHVSVIAVFYSPKMCKLFNFQTSLIWFGS